MKRRLVQCCLILCCIPVYSVFSAEIHIHIVLENHLFKPSKILIPKHTKVILDIQNNDPDYEKFSSFGLNREKVLLPQRITRIYLSPLPKGRYVFTGDFHPASARGVVIVGEPQINCLDKLQEGNDVC
ncbi:cupredoxin domain-containing protein [Opacimonas viscosa]|uniref:Cupredoxin domain-containing protein n=1 Tax=Opacimonas viscosa TaxID=2961944 RepID=A0AA41X2G6_9ALTE|nr:cupredoxin domain-containing protein [Opacimonas viscosa]MCP3429151.1 cupredoxin domain-containing protein [Opacimonas viscosa]